VKAGVGRYGWMDGVGLRSGMIEEELHALLGRVGLQRF
jgi:hypothetical protein